MIYFDNNATTRVADEVLETMMPFLTHSFGNPSGSYSIGAEAARAVSQARASVTETLGAASADEIAFTSGGTESDNWAILGATVRHPQKKHIITTRVEHDAVGKVCKRLEGQGYRVTWLEVDTQGMLDLNDLRTSLSHETAVVSIMMANNETGILFPIREIGEIIKENSQALFHVDGVNAVGKLPINLGETEVDLFSISGHKFYAPKGIGALYIRRGIDLPPSALGGKQESGRRAGTEAVHQIAGLGAAADLVRNMSSIERIQNLRDRLEDGILSHIPNAVLNGTSDASKRLPNTSSISFEDINGELLMARLEAMGICVSTGSACNSATRTQSPVLAAMNIPYRTAMGSIRFSLGRYNDADEVDFVLRHLPSMVADLQKTSGIPNLGD